MQQLLLLGDQFVFVSTENFYFLSIYTDLLSGYSAASNLPFTVHDQVCTLCHLTYYHPLPDLPAEGCVVLGEYPGQ